MSGPVCPTQSGSLSHTCSYLAQSGLEQTLNCAALLAVGGGGQGQLCDGASGADAGGDDVLVELGNLQTGRKRNRGKSRWSGHGVQWAISWHRNISLDSSPLSLYSSTNGGQGSLLAFLFPIPQPSFIPERGSSGSSRSPCPTDGCRWTCIHASPQ